MAPIPKTPSGVGVPVPGAPAAPSAPAAPAAPSTPADPPAAQAAPNTSWVAPKKAPRKRDLQAAPRPPAMRDIGGPAGQVAAPLPNAPNAPTHPKTKKPSLGQELGHIAKDFLGGVASAFEDAVRNTQVQVNIGTPPGFPPGHPVPLPPLPPGQAVRKHDIPPDATAPIVYADPPAPPLPKSGEPAPAPLPKTVDQPPAPLPKTVDQPPAPVKSPEPLPAPSVAEPGSAATAPQTLQLSRLLGRYIAPGPDIAQAQAMLNELGGAQLETDGKFGPLTEAAVRKFQTDNGLKIDGVIGPQTQGKLNELAAAKAKPPPTPAAPAEPAEPAAPAGPATPAEPATPAGPATPAEPAGPAGPATPAEPVTPAGPTAPATPSGAVDPDTQLTFDRNGGLNAAELTTVAGDVNQDMGLPRAATAEQQALVQKYADPAHFEAFAKSADTQASLQEFVNLAKPPTPEAAAASKQEFLRGLYEAKFANEYANAFAPKPDTNVDTDTMLSFDKNGGPKPLDLGFEAAELMGKTETVGGLPELTKEQLQFVRDFGANDKFAKFASDPKVQEALQKHVAANHRGVPADQIAELKQSWLKSAYTDEFKKEFAKAFPNDVKAAPADAKPVPGAATPEVKPVPAPATPAIITQVKVEELPLAALAPDPVKLSADMALEKIALAQEQGTNDVLPNGAQLEFTSQYATPENFARFAKRADVQAALTKHLEGKKLTTAGEANQAAADFLRSEFSTQFRKDFRAKFGAAKAKPTVSDDELRALRTELEAAQAALAAAVERQAVMQRRLEAWLRPAA